MAQVPADILVEVSVIERSGRPDRMDKPAGVDRAAGVRSGLDGIDEAELGEQFREGIGAHGKPLRERETFSVDGLHDAGDRWAGSLRVEPEVSGGGLDHRTPQSLLVVSTGNITNAALLSLFEIHLDEIVSAFGETGFVELSHDALSLGRPTRGTDS